MAFIVTVIIVPVYKHENKNPSPSLYIVDVGGGGLVGYVVDHILYYRHMHL